MRAVWSSIEIEAPASQVWTLLVEPRFWPEWGPTVRDVRLGADRIALGRKGSVQTAIGLWVPFEITRFEPERYWDWSVAGLHATGHRLTPLSSARTTAEFSVPLLFAPYRFVLARGLRRLKTLAEARSRRDEEGVAPAV